MKNNITQQRGYISKTLLIIMAFVFIVIVVNLVYYFYWKGEQESQKVISAIEKEELDTEMNTIKSEEEGVIVEAEEREVDFDYEDLDLLSSIVPCYLNDNPRDLAYFPEGQLRAFFDNISNDSKLDDIDCGIYDFEEVDTYVASLFQTDHDNDGLNLYLENIYFTDDNKQDTDGDDYDDLTEINNGYNPNDANNDPGGLDFYDHEEELVDEPRSEPGSEPEPEEEGEDGNNGNDIDQPQVSEINTPEDCLSLAASEVNECLNDFVISTGTLLPCTFSDDFNRCVASAVVFQSIASSAECYEYDNLMNISNFDRCISVRSLIENDVNMCFDLKESLPIGCINSLVDLNEDVDLCAYVYFLQDSINSTDGFQYHEECINRVYIAEPQVEMQAVSGCHSIDLAASSAAILYKMMCFVNLAVAYDDASYCNDAAMITGELNQATLSECTNKLIQ